MCTEYIYRHITRLPPSTIFTTRELLLYGKRSAVDQALYRMVKAKVLIRLARGVFVRDDSSNPSPLEIAAVKAAAYGKKLFTFGQTLLNEFGLSSANDQTKATFAVNSHSSSFWTIQGRVYLRGIGPRKVALSETEVGQIVYALWHLGASQCSQQEVTTITRNLKRTEREQFRLAASLMPAWLNELCMFRYPAAKVA